MPKAITPKTKSKPKTQTRSRKAAAPIETKAQSEMSSSSNAQRSLSADERRQMIQYAAYHIAEKDGFQAGKEQDYWYQAEKQINDLFSAHDNNADVH